MTAVEIVKQRIRDAEQAIDEALRRAFAESLLLSSEELMRREIEALKVLVP